MKPLTNRDKALTYSRWSCIRESQEQGQFPFGYQLRMYAEQILGRIKITQNLLIFVLSLLPEDIHVAALRLVRRQAAAKSGKNLTPSSVRKADNITFDVEGYARAIHRTLMVCKDMSVTTILEVLLLSSVKDDQEKYVKADGMLICGRMADLQRLFGLSDDELALLSVILCYSNSRSFEAFIDSVCVQEKRELIGVLTNMSTQRLASVTGRRGRLVQAGILEVPSHWSDCSFYKLDAEIRDHLLGLGDESLALKFASLAGKSQFDPECFGLPEETVRITLGLVRANLPCNILLHGVPGTGKTEFAKSLAAACGKQAYFVSHAAGEGMQHGRVAVEAVTAAYQAGEFIVVVDEADDLLNLRGASISPFAGRARNGLPGKSWLNDFLDRCQAQVIWITNEVDSIDESSMRRFAYNIPFRRQSAGRRLEIWKEHLRESPLRPLLAADDIADMARKYRVGAAGIANALIHASRIIPADAADKTTVIGTLRELLSSHERLTGGGSDAKLVGLAAQYDPEAVCTDVPADGIVAGLRSCVSQQRAERPAANLLFWGPPGTGKSAFAQYLAQSLDKELIIRRASDLLSMYVGGTEHNIRDAFEQASHEDAILLLDEADSFFIDRTRAQRSWETSQTNELLTQMENHHGILVCCTNLLDSLDHAVLRRFAWKVRFQAPTPAARQRIYRRYFETPENSVSAASLDRLSLIEHLTPGDMKAVWVRFRFRPAAEWNHQEIVQALFEEVAYRGQKSTAMGFHGAA